MAIRKRGKSFQVRVRPFPEQSLPTKAAAERVERKLKERKALGDLFVEKPAALGEVLDGHQERREAFGGRRGALRPATVAFNAQCRRPWGPLDAMSLTALRRTHVEDHLADRAAVAPVAAKNELQFLKSALKEAESRGQRVDPGIYAIQPIAHEAVEGRALTADELFLLSDSMPERIRRIVLVAGLVGLRWSEAVNLTDRMVDLEAATLTIPRDLNKSRREKPIRLMATEVQVLREQLLARPNGTHLLFPNLAGGVYTKSGFYSVWHRATRVAGLDGFRFHWLRHTAISLMVASGMSPAVIAERVGHSDGGALIMRRYAHVYDEQRQQQLDQFDAFISVPVVVTEWSGEAAEL